MEERILTKHPKGKKGVRISKKKYDIVKSSIVECLRTQKLTHSNLAKCVQENLEAKFEGSTSWYTETVKLDLEARNIIERTADTKPPLYMLKNAESSSRITP